MKTEFKKRCQVCEWCRDSKVFVQPGYGQGRYLTLKICYRQFPDKKPEVQADDFCPHFKDRTV